MCGIAGIVDLHARREIDRDALARMSAALAHRGPDGAGDFIAPGVGFAHRRLAIIDRDGGAQPFVAAGGGVLNFNGEIYSHEALRDAMRRDGAMFCTRSDTEVLAEGLVREGDAFLHRLRGMFAFAFWDPDRRTVLLARDRLGEKPLYYGQTQDGFFVFASEIGAMTASGLFPRDLREDAIADYLFYGYTPDPKSIYRGVFKLPAAHTLRVGAGGDSEPQRYWRPVFAPSDRPNFEDAASLLREQIDDAVAAQMTADAPLGAFLSGGVDSAGVAAAMTRGKSGVSTFTVGFTNGDGAPTAEDERDDARGLAARLGAAHHDIAADLTLETTLDAVAAALGEPFADSAALPGYRVAELARRHVTVALTGDGGDEIFAGYRRYRMVLAEDAWRAAAPGAVRRAVFGPMGAAYPKLDWAPRPLRAKTTLQALAASGADAYAAAVAITLPARSDKILSADLHNALAGYRPKSIVADAYKAADTDDALAAALYADTQTWLPGRMLVKIDRTSMAHGLEARPPLLDHRLVEWAGLVPSAYKLKDGVGKRILKAALTPRLGADYLARPKRGFAAPVSTYFRQKGVAAGRIETSPYWRQSGLFNVDAVDAMLRAHRRGAQNCGQELWSVLMFDAFLRQQH